jgi:uncharacterized protein (TIGR03083 family)
MIEHQTFVDAIRRDGTRVVEAARAAGVDADVPSCPDWRVADLLAHVGLIHRWVAGIVRTRPADPVDHWRQHEPPADAGARIDWFEAGCAELATALSSAAPTDQAWTWTPDRTVGFWARRMAHELAVHRWDAQTAITSDAAGAPPDPVARELAVDGVQEVFDILPVRTAADPIRGQGESIHLHCTDADGEWLVRLEPDRVVVTREHAKGDVAARASASELFLLLWGRIAPGTVDVFGDRELLERFQERVRF